MSRFAVFFALVITPLAAACNPRANADCGTLSSSSNSASGVTTCGTLSCTAGTYCSNPSGNVCANGCKEDDNCGQGQRCDLSNAQTDLGGNKVGTCVTEPLSDQNSGCEDSGTSESDAGDAGDASSPKDAGADAR